MTPPQPKKRYKVKAPQRKGCPLKYAYVVQGLENDKVYTAACIIEEGIKKGLIPKDDTILHRRIRMSLNKLIHAREFPRSGDDIVKRHGQRPQPGFLGERWKQAVDYDTFFPEDTER